MTKEEIQLDKLETTDDDITNICNGQKKRVAIVEGATGETTFF